MRLVLVLPVHVDEAAAGLAQRAAGREDAIDQGAAAALGGDFAAHDHLAAVVGLEDRFDARLVFARAHEVGRGTAADEQADGAHQDALAGAGLAGEDGKAGLEFQLQPVDDSEVSKICTLGGRRFTM